MSSIVFATHNLHKVLEVNALLAGRLTVMSLGDVGFTAEIPEPYSTLEENALAKARTIKEATGYDCFSEDSGLFVPELGGEPGVLSARYAGPNADAASNMSKLQQRMGTHEWLDAYFKTVIVLLYKGAEHMFEGVCVGRIINKQLGDGGFGYDPMFVPQGEARSFAQMSLDEKSLISHRSKAVTKLIGFLEDACR